MSLALTGHATHIRTRVLTAVLGLSGTNLGRIPLFVLGAATAQAGCAATAQAGCAATAQFTLDPAAPRALTAGFGAPT